MPYSESERDEFWAKIIRQVRAIAASFSKAHNHQHQADELEGAALLRLARKSLTIKAIPEGKQRNAYVSTMTHNAIKSYLRWENRQKRKPPPGRHDCTALVSKEQTPSVLDYRSELHERLKGHIQKLKDDDRKIIELRMMEENYNEIASTLQISEICARKRYERALARLKTNLLREFPSLSQVDTEA